MSPASTMPKTPDELVIQWEEPPKRAALGRPAFDWYAALAPLKAKPGKWGRILGPLDPAKNSGKASTIKANLKANGHDGAFEVVGRSTDGKLYVYARFVGQA